MALFTERNLREAARRSRTTMGKSMDRAFSVARHDSNDDSFDIFLSHSVKDADIVLGAAEILNSHNFTVYVDWVVDAELKHDRVTPRNADVLRRRMYQCRSLLYIKTENSTDSTWMPWELGFFDGYNGRVCIFPVTSRERDDYAGNEYLGLYPYVDVGANKKGDDSLWVNRNRNECAEFGDWLQNPKTFEKWR